MITLSQTYSPIQSQNSVSHKFVTKFSEVLFTKFGDLENSSPNWVINPSQNLTLNTLKLIPLWYIWNIADSMASLKSENWGRKVLGNTALFLLATRVLLASPNFGQAKHGQNGPAATDCQQCIFYPICGHHFTHRTHTDISFRFRPGGRRLKNFRFSRIFISLW